MALIGLHSNAYFKPSRANVADSYKVRSNPELEITTPDAPEVVPGASQEFTQAYAAPAGSDPQQAGREARKLIDSELYSRGALVLRGLPITTPEQCSEFVSAMDFQRAPYEPFGRGRAKVAENLDAATTIPNRKVLPMHNEMSYNPRPVNKIMLLCIEAAERGGENLVAKNSDVLECLPQSVLDSFEEKGGVRYVRTYPSAKAEPTGGPAFITWQERTGTDDPEAAMQFWRNLGFTEVSMDSQETMVVANTEAACRQAPTGSRPFLNNANLPVLMPSSTEVMYEVTYGSGEEIPMETQSAINKAQWSAARALPLETGSALVLDNYNVMHGRLPYEGGNRTMVTVLTSN